MEMRETHAIQNARIYSLHDFIRSIFFFFIFFYKNSYASNNNSTNMACVLYSALMVELALAEIHLFIMKINNESLAPSLCVSC